MCGQFRPLPEPGLITHELPGAVTLTLDPGTQHMTFNDYINSTVPLDIQTEVMFSVIVADQVMEFDEQVDGLGSFQIAQGTVQVDACMRLTGTVGRFDFPFLADITDLPELVINAPTCTEGTLNIDNGTLKANANFRSKAPGWSLGSTCFVPPEGGGSCSSNGDTVIDAAPNKQFILDGTGGTCPSCS